MSLPVDPPLPASPYRHKHNSSDPNPSTAIDLASSILKLCNHGVLCVRTLKTISSPNKADPQSLEPAHDTRLQECLWRIRQICEILESRDLAADEEDNLLVQEYHEGAADAISRIRAISRTLEGVLDTFRVRNTGIAKTRDGGKLGIAILVNDGVGAELDFENRAKDLEGCRDELSMILVRSTNHQLQLLKRRTADFPRDLQPKLQELVQLTGNNMAARPQRLIRGRTWLQSPMASRENLRSDSNKDSPGLKESTSVSSLRNALARSKHCDGDGDDDEGVDCVYNDMMKGAFSNEVCAVFANFDYVAWETRVNAATRQACLWMILYFGAFMSFIANLFIYVKALHSREVSTDSMGRNWGVPNHVKPRPSLAWNWGIYVEPTHEMNHVTVEEAQEKN